jgi:ketosteroid isomerase-like protein
MEDAKGEWDSFEATVSELIDLGERLLTVVRVHARGRASGALIEGTILHVATMRDGLILRLDAFTKRDSAMRVLAAPQTDARGRLD